MLKVQAGKSTTGFLYAKSQTDLIHTQVSASQQVRGQWLSGTFRMLVDACLLDDPKWYVPLSEALVPRPGECILDCGPGSVLRALYYADRFPDTEFTAVEFNRRRIAKAFKRASSMNLPNYKAMTFEDARRTPFSAGQFDKAMLVLNLHGLEPEDKINNLRELRRIVRRGGIVLAADIDRPKASRAVGAAVGKNPVSFVVPCHRALGKSGTLTGYHWGITRKQAMLGWEAGRVGN